MHATSGHSIHHFVLEAPSTLLTLLQKELKFSEQYATDLLQLGSVYLNDKRMRCDHSLVTSDYVRIHASPKRYSTEQLEWDRFILFQNEDFIVVNKPSGIPVPSTVDNHIENLGYQLGKYLGQELYITHRLDVPVSGLVVLAKNKSFQSYYNRMLIKRKVHKQYRALVSQSVSCGRKIHYMFKSDRAPKILYDEPAPDRWECVLEVIRCTPQGNHYLVELILETGRTHQIRSQLGALGAPILGDALYDASQPISAFTKPTAIALQAYQLAFPGFQFTLPNPWLENT